jgi:thiamine pyrophosphokinase
MPAKEVEAARAAARPTASREAPERAVVVSRDRWTTQEPGRKAPMRIVIVAGGELDPGDADRLDGADLVIAADGGASALDALGRRPDRLVGDLDSVDPALVVRLEGDGVPVDRYPRDKDASDTELALAAAIAAGATELVLLGAIGGARLDHELANLLLVADPDHASRDLRAVRGGTTVRAVHGGRHLELVGTAGDLVTLLPLGEGAHGVTTGGLRWALSDATLTLGGSRGLSNVVDSAPASVSLERGTLLVVETTAQGANP